MKKQLLTLALLAVAGTAGAQQLPNGSFDEGKWGDCIPFTGGAYKKTCGKCPVSWTISHVIGANGTGKKEVGSQEPNGNTGSAVKIYNTTTTGDNPVPGYFTLGTTWSTAKITSLYPMVVSDKDGGTFGGISFKYKPDALEFYFKRSITGANVQSSFIAYLWNGTVTQNNVPVSSPAVGNPKKYNMPNRDIFVLRKDDLTASCQGDKNPTNPTHLIASLEEYTTETTDAWTKKTYEFKYNDAYKAETPEFINVIFAASDYFNSSNVTDGVSLSIDDVKLIYYKHLKSLTIDGTTPSTFVGDDTQNNTNEVNIDASDKYYTEGCISATAAGAGAKVDETYNPSTYVCTLEVTAGDDEVKNYNIQFGVPCTGKLSSLTVNGTAVELEDGKYYYVVTGDRGANSVSYVKEDGDKATAAESYDADKRISTIKVTAPGAEDHTYYVKFAKATTDYKGKMSIVMNEDLLSAATSTVGITTPVDGKADFQLLGFELSGDPIGDIFVTDVPYTEEDGVVNLYKEQTITIFGDNGAGLGPLPVVFKGTLKDGKLTANIDIAPAGVTVDIVPLDAPSLDFSSNAVDLSGTSLADMKADMTNKNLTIFLPEATEGVDAKEKNVVVGTTASSLSLADGNDWGVTKNFTAAAVSYDRVFKTGTDYVQSFVLPFGFTVPTGTTVAELSSVNGDNLVFKPVTETVANKPYLVVTTDGDFINKLTDVQVKATTGADLTTTVKGVSHIGSYTAQNVANVYGYANGKFVKANTGSVKPFRTYVKVAEGTQAAPMAFGVNIEGTVTGINNATTAATAKEAIYNLQGVRVSGDLKHLTKGVYIVNGQKAVVK
ncbi:calycin-like domain-containing protein [Prevotellamassilia timonensis]|uniref:calycin-like domain-containing protein n=1 Tax=Prevotellamassilia timonensis TaxID=1852370 RepID=UPI00307C5EE2